MSQSFWTILIVYFVVFSYELIQCTGDVNVSLSESCKYPVVQTRFFDDEHSSSKQPPELQVINSNEDVDKEFPYQYILMSCNALYPIEWIGDVPQHYFYSYILDDEVRSVVNDNVGKSHAQQYDNNKVSNENQSEHFTVRLHVGNETLSKNTSMNVNIICQPVEQENKVCGKIMVSIRKYNGGPAKNKAMLRIQFNKVPLLDEGIKNKSSYVDNEHPIKTCSSRNSTQGLKRESTSFQCNSTWVGSRDFFSLDREFRESPTCPQDTGVASQLEINETSLEPPCGILTCSEHTHKEEIRIPYFFSLPKLCPNEAITLPHLYYRNNSLNQITSTLRETDFLSLCVQNASTNNIYVGDTVIVTCISSIYYFAQGIRIQLTHKSQSNLKHVEHDLGKSEREQSFGNAGYRNITTTFIVANDNIQQVNCSAPVRKNRKWIGKATWFKPKIPVKLSFHRTSDTVTNDVATGVPHLTCNASGDPLPILMWSRLNNEELPENQTTIMQSGEKLIWVASVLYFPTESTANLSEYYGRYICTAKNKFQSIEKIFLFDERTNGDETSIFGGNAIFNGFFGRAVWFWIIVGLAMLMLVGTVALLGWKLRKQTQHLRLFSKDEIDDFLFGNPDLLLDDTDAYEEMNTYAAYLPYDKNRFEIEKEQLEFDTKDILGTGAYGTVYKGIFKDGFGKVEPVAIKTVTPSSDKMYFAALLSEIKIMCYIGKHGNVVGLVGACTKYLDQRQIFVATEYCPNGDMLSYILKHRNTFIKNAGLESKREPKNWVKKPGSNGYCRLAYARLLLSPHLLLVWALQIAQGMTYLSSKKVIHGDLAARNVLLAGDLKPKIADFGLSKQLQKYSNYVTKGDDLVPWRWLAVECLQFMKFSIQSDVWAFGVVLFELFTLGQVPYGSHTYSELFIVSLCQGERLQQPAFASDKVYGLMLDCWKHAPENRPSFESLENELRTMSAESERKMLLSISTTPGVTTTTTTTTTNGKVETINRVNETRYVNGGVQGKEKAKDIFKIQTYIRNENVFDNTKNGYVTEVQPTTTLQQVQISKRYVEHLESSLPPPLPSKSYVDWNVA